MSRPALRLAIGGVELVTLAPHHVNDLAALRVENADDVRQSSATRHPHESTVAGVARSLRYRIEAWTLDLYPFVIIRDGAIVGDLNLSQVTRGPEETANVGLLVDRAARGQGIGTAAIALVCRLAFEELGLHRLQAGIQPANVASQKAFIGNDFEGIGLARGFLFVDGAWRDHLLFQKLVPGD